ncbi:hypothetical protein [Pelagibacterium xiamenense]|uniref:hypothetical protein n=1 Tax=Pelagibacterium xiamenense TaxID=2901140 RepID=UPI001E4F68BA|nr:hypothetical protein [Pelagibacterium xiamenense]MCD7060075.1 hypothetical protein [Pelagibacterium xiamenense]
MFEWIGEAGSFVKGAAVAALGAVGIGEEPPAYYPLDGMLAGFETACAISPDLESLWASMAHGETPVLPADGAEYFDAAEVRIAEDYREIRLPVRGLWKDYAVNALTVVAGNDNGISSFSVHFAPGQPALAATFGPLAEASSAAMAADPDNLVAFTTDFGTFNGITQYYCDFST